MFSVERLEIGYSPPRATQQGQESCEEHVLWWNTCVNTVLNIPILLVQYNGIDENFDMVLDEKEEMLTFFPMVSRLACGMNER